MTAPFPEYEGRTVLVVGAASGMGRAATTMLIAAGATVHTADLRTHDLPVAMHTPADLRTGGGIDAVVAAAPQGLDAVFLCAGLPQTFPAHEVVGVNFVATRALIDRLVPRIREGGSITAIVSMTYGWERMGATVDELIATPDEVHARAWLADRANLASLGDPYVASKFALTAWAMERAPQLATTHGVRLNLLGPGSTDTPMYEQFIESVGEEQLAMTTAVMGRTSHAEEQAYALLFLGSPSNSYMVGTLLLNDGGTSAAMAAMGYSRATRKARAARVDRGGA